MINLEPKEPPIWVAVAWGTVHKACCTRAVKSFISTSNRINLRFRSLLHADPYPLHAATHRKALYFHLESNASPARVSAAYGAVSGVCCGTRQKFFYFQLEPNQPLIRIPAACGSVYRAVYRTKKSFIFAFRRQVAHSDLNEPLLRKGRAVKYKKCDI